MALKYIPFGRTACGWTPVRMMDSTGFSYVDKSGNVMPLRFDEVAPFDNEVAIVKTKDAPEGRNYTYLRADGKLCPMRFTDVYPFLEDQTKAYVDEEKFYVTKDFVCWQFANDLYENLKIAGPNSGGLKIHFTRSGKTLEFNFHVLGYASERMLPIRMKDKTGCTFLNLDTLRILENRFADITGFWKGFALVRDFDGRDFFINKKGHSYDKKTVEEYVTQNLFKELRQAKEDGTLDKLLAQYGLPADYLDHIPDFDQLEEYMESMEDYDDEDDDDYDDEHDDYDDYGDRY